MRRFTRRATTLLAAGLLTSLMATSAMAADVSQSVEGGTLTASSTVSTALSAVTYSHSSQTSPGELTLNVDDSRGTGEGWNVNVQSSAFVYDDGDAGTTEDGSHDITASNFALTSAATPVLVAGQAVDATNGPKVVTGTGTLDVARTVVDANVDYGQGEYDQALGVELTVPGQARAGTYTGTVTTTSTSGPSA